MVQDHNWSWNDLQNMIPFERDIYLLLLNSWIRERKEEEAKK